MVESVHRIQLVGGIWTHFKRSITHDDAQLLVNSLAYDYSASDNCLTLHKTVPTHVDVERHN